MLSGLATLELLQDSTNFATMTDGTKVVKDEALSYHCRKCFHSVMLYINPIFHELT